MGAPAFYAVAPHDEGFWLAWSDDEQMHYQLYALDGTPLLEPASGRDVAGCENYFFSPELVPDGGGGFYLVGTSGRCRDELDFNYTHINSNGDPASPLYQDEGILPVVNSRYSQHDLNLAPDGEGGFLAAWNDCRSAYSYDFMDVYATRINDHLVSEAEEHPATLHPDCFILHPAYPNPFNASTSIRFTLPEAGNVRLSVFDILGRRVAVLLNKTMERGIYRVSWDGLGENRAKAASGMYFLALDSGGIIRTQRVVLVQ